MTVTADDLDTVLTHVLDTLNPTVDQDWSVAAGSLEWSCATTADHLGQALMHWSSQLAIHAKTRYVRWHARVHPEAPPAGMLDFVEASGRILAQVIRSSSADLRVFHPWGIADPEGFAGMGCIELLLHGEDLATGLGTALDPPRDVCDRVMARMFPDHPAMDSWTGLRRATGRLEVEGLPRVEQWKWRGTPLDEDWDPAPEPEPMRF